MKISEGGKGGREGGGPFERMYHAQISPGV